MSNNVKIFIGVIAILILGVIGTVILGGSPTTTTTQGPSKYNDFAVCLKDKGAQFYGAFWCPHCQAQEKSFEMSRQQLESIGLYFECSTPDGNSQLPACTQKGVQSYPTWFFPDGSKLTGEQTLQALADKTSCTLPQ